MLKLLKETAASWTAHKAPKMGAALAYYTAFSLAPLVVLVVGIVSLFVEQSAARAGIVAQFPNRPRKNCVIQIRTLPTAERLCFLSDAVLKRVEKHGDLFAPVLTLNRKLPRLDAVA